MLFVRPSNDLCLCICTSQGELELADRDRVVTEFREGVTKVLISTDVLARGFDVSQVSTSLAGVQLRSVCMMVAACCISRCSHGPEGLH